MRKLLIDDRIRGFAQQYASALQAEQPNVVSDLEDLRDSVIAFNAWADPTAPKKYIDALIADYPAVLTLEPKDWNLNKYDDILKQEPDMLTRPVVYGYTKERKKGGKVVKASRPLSDTFYERIMFCLRYKAARKILGPIHQQMGLKACYYCNISPTDSSDDGEVFYEMDHLKAQSLYPCLGTCFYNLQPCDGACNKRKLNNPCDSQMYVNDENEERSPFHFEPQVVELGKTRGDYKCMQINFVDKQGVYSDACKQYDETFGIVSHYSAHKKDVEDVYVQNQRCGSVGMAEHYKKSIGYEPSRDEVFQFCLGFPYNEDLIHEAPLRKLKYDTVKQLEDSGALKV